MCRRRRVDQPSPARLVEQVGGDDRRMVELTNRPAVRSSLPAPSSADLLGKTLEK